ncbi:MAG TPA: YceI family protein [Mariprofundaceae bacterium]|nr:YceI family protein [Mariprofundaceae bacterium]
MKLKTILLTGLLTLGITTTAQAETYKIDDAGAHAFIQFKVKHLGYSWLLGRFNTFEGTFNYDEKNPSASKIEVKIDTNSVDSNHALRDKHLRSKDFLMTGRYPEAKFVSTSFKEDGKNIEIKGKFTFHGVTKDMTIKGNHIGAGKDPWGGYRRGFEGWTSFRMADYGMLYNLGPASEEVELYFSIEGIRQ